MKKRADGLYQKQVTVGRTPEGKPVRRTVYGRTRREVEAKAAESLKAGPPKPPGASVTLADYARMWLATAKPGKSRNTMAMYSFIVGTHILREPYSAHPLASVTAAEIRGTAARLAGEGKERTAQVFSMTMRQIIRAAALEGLTGLNPASVPAVSYRAPAKRALLPHEREALELADLTPRERAYVGLMLYCGLRSGEALALKRGDVTLADGIVSVGGSVSYGAGNAGHLEPTAKTKSSNRRIPVPEPLMRPLEAVCTAIDPAALLFAARGGGPLSKSSKQRMWESVMRKARAVSRLPLAFTAHMLRHTYVTDLFAAGIPPRTAQALTGHGDISVLMEVYNHLDTRDSALAALDEYYKSTTLLRGYYGTKVNGG